MSSTVVCLLWSIVCFFFMIFVPSILHSSRRAKVGWQEFHQELQTRLEFFAETRLEYYEYPLFKSPPVDDCCWSRRTVVPKGIVLLDITRDPNNGVIHLRPYWSSIRDLKALSKGWSFSPESGPSRGSG